MTEGSNPLDRLPPLSHPMALREANERAREKARQAHENGSTIRANVFQLARAILVDEVIPDLASKPAAELDELVRAWWVEEKRDQLERSVKARLARAVKA